MARYLFADVYVIVLVIGRVAVSGSLDVIGGSPVGFTER
jgi:hypothetical protein